MSGFLKNLAGGLLIATGLSGGIAHAQPTTRGIEITGTWARISTTGEVNAYFDILNHGPDGNSLLSATTPVAEKVTLNRLRMKAGNPRVDDLSEIKVSAAGRTTLKPGNYYLALAELKGPVAPGTVVPLTLHFTHGPDVQVEAKVTNQLLGNRGR